MKSLHAWILLAITATLLLALAVFIKISNHVQRASLYPIFEAMDQLELDDAMKALGVGGPAAASAYMKHLDQLFGAHHYLLDGRGLDVTSGENLSALLPKLPNERKSRGYQQGRLVITHESSDGHYWFVAVNAKGPNRWTFFPYYLLVIGVTAVIYWLSTTGVLRPLQRIARTLDRFGGGDLSVRLRSGRRDEIGMLAQSFDGMADRIQTLLTSEQRLLADISHELRSPLTRIKFALALTESDASQRGAFDRVQREVNRITALVSELTELARAEGDPLERRLAPIELQDLFEESVCDCELEAQARGCTIDVHGDLRATVIGDRELLRRVFENVLRNAIRYSPSGGIIESLLSRGATGAIVVIRDFGPGVPENLLQDIFEPFFRVEEARDTHSGGVGLGLSIAKRALQVHGGSIAAENACPGLRVRITIPLATAA